MDTIFKDWVFATVKWRQGLVEKNLFYADLSQKQKKNQYKTTLDTLVANGKYA